MNYALFSAEQPTQLAKTAPRLVGWFVSSRSSSFQSHLGISGYAEKRCRQNGTPPSQERLFNCPFWVDSWRDSLYFAALSETPSELSIGLQMGRVASSNARTPPRPSISMRFEPWAPCRIGCCLACNSTDCKTVFEDLVRWPYQSENTPIRGRASDDHTTMSRRSRPAIARTAALVFRLTLYVPSVDITWVEMWSRWAIKLSKLFDCRRTILEGRRRISAVLAFNL